MSLDNVFITDPQELTDMLYHAVLFRDNIRDLNLISKKRFDGFIEESKGVYGSAIQASLSNGLEGFICCYRLQTAYACSQAHYLISIIRDEDIKEGIRLSEVRK